MTRAWELHSTIRAAGILALAAGATAGCRSGLHTPAVDASLAPAPDAGKLDGFAGAGGSGGMGTGGAGGAVPSTDVRPCQGIDPPDFDCGFGAPTYYCVAGDGGGAWTFICPDAPADASVRETGAGGGGGNGGVATGGSGSGGIGGVPSDCDAIALEIAKQTQTIGTCTAVVRLDYTSLKILGHAFVCGQYTPTDEAAARKTASADAVFPYSSGAGAGNLLSGPAPKDEWVFSTSPSDFGGGAAVSARSGLTVFAGSIVWAGTGSIMLPSAWSTSDLGSRCTPPDSLPVRGFDLIGGQAPAQTNQAAAVVLATALPSAFTSWGSLFDVVVLLYPRSVGDFDPRTAEYVVLLNAGWLE